MENPTALPWYRHLWPWLLMLGPTLVIVAGLLTAWLAWRGQDGLVVDDYYQAGKAINRQIIRDERAKQWGLRAHFEQIGNTLQIVVRGNADFRMPSSMSVLLVHPTQSKNDVKIILHPTQTGTWVGTLPSGYQLHALRHSMVLEDDEKNWRLVYEIKPNSTLKQ